MFMCKLIVKHIEIVLSILEKHMLTVFNLSVHCWIFYVILEIHLLTVFVCLVIAGSSMLSDKSLFLLITASMHSLTRTQSQKQNQMVSSRILPKFSKEGNPFNHTSGF